MRAFLVTVLVWFILFAVPFVIYGSAATFFGLKPPSGPAWRFLLSVGITKIGTAAAFVIIFASSRDLWRGHWLLYACIWFAMFAISEVGELVKPGAGFAEAMIGIVSEAIYAPLSAFAVDRLFR